MRVLVGESPRGEWVGVRVEGSTEPETEDWVAREGWGHCLVHRQPGFGPLTRSRISLNHVTCVSCASPRESKRSFEVR